MNVAPLGSAPTSITPRRGRPRNARCDEAILQATLEMLLEGGAANLSIDGVAQRAGVGKATIYRRWPSKESLVLDAISTDTATMDIAPCDTLRADLEAYFDVVLLRYSTAKTSDVLPYLIEAACYDPEVRASLDAYIASRQTPVREALLRAQARGELDPTIDITVLVDVLLGPLMYRRLVTGGHVDRPFVTSLIDIVTIPPRSGNTAETTT